MKPTYEPWFPSLPLGQNRENVRQHNLSVVLRMLYLQGTLSRSTLTAITGLNRSTISDLVTELSDLGLAFESEAASPAGQGRPSLMVSASDKVVAFSVHPEYDATTVGVVALSGKVISKTRVKAKKSPTVQSSVEIASSTISQIRSTLKSDIRIVGVGVAVPGQVRVADGVIRHAPHLGWIEAPYGPLLSQATGLKVWIDNDASLGCMAEFNHGSARGFSDIVYLYAGAGGIGGGVIINGKQLRGSSGYGGELGHVKISTTTEKDNSGLAGTLEALLKREELLKIFDIKSATDEELEKLILKNTERKTLDLLNGQIDTLGTGLGSFVNIFNPQAIVLAGFLDSLFKFDSERLIKRMRESSLTSSHESVLLLSGALGGNLLMTGASELPFNSLIEDPSGTHLVKANSHGSRLSAI